MTEVTHMTINSVSDRPRIVKRSHKKLVKMIRALEQEQLDMAEVKFSSCLRLSIEIFLRVSSHSPAEYRSRSYYLQTYKGDGTSLSSERLLFA